jgi:hypothetical protein
MSVKVYNQNAPLVDPKTGKIVPPWNSFFQDSTQAPPAVAVVSVGASPFSYTPNIKGQVVITGGTVSDISIVRGTVSISLFNSTANARVVLASIADTVIITYSVPPIVRFLEF